MYPTINTGKNIMISLSLLNHPFHSHMHSSLHVIQSSKHCPRNRLHMIFPPHIRHPIKSLPHPQMTHHIQHPRRIRRWCQFRGQYSEFLFAQFIPEFIRVGECVPGAAGGGGARESDCVHVGEDVWDNVGYECWFVVVGARRRRWQ